MRFFPASCFGKSPLLFCHFYRVLLFLGFLRGGFSETSSGAREGRGESWFLIGKMLYFRSKNPAAKVLFLLAWLFRVLLFLGTLVSESFVGRTPVIYSEFFWARFCC